MDPIQVLYIVPEHKIIIPEQVHLVSYYMASVSLNIIKEKHEKSTFIDNTAVRRIT